MKTLTLDVPFHLNNPWKFPLHGIPLRCSVPFPEGSVRDPSAELNLLDEKGIDLAAQWRVLSRWKDGSARFALMDYSEPTIPPRTQRACRLKRRDNPAASVAKPSAAITIQEDSSFLRVDTGRLSWKFSKKRFSFAEEIRFGDREWIAGVESDLCVADMFGQIFRASLGEYRIRIEERGAYRVIVLIEGDYRTPLGRFMNYRMRLHFTLGGSQVLMQHTVRNRHDGREGRDIRRLWLEGGLRMDESAIRRILQVDRTLNTTQAIVEIPENVDLDTGVYQTLIRNKVSLREDPADICYSTSHGTNIGAHGSCAPLIDLHQPGAGGMLFKFAMAMPDYEGPLRLSSDRNRFAMDFYPESDRKSVV